MTGRLLATLLLVSTSFTLLPAQGNYPPAAGQEGSTAISKDSSIIKTWAIGIELTRGNVQINDTSIYASGSNFATFGHPSEALHTASGNSTSVVSLGDGGIATLTFDRLIVDGPGPDFAVFENSFTDTFLELAFVEVSSDGINFSRFPAVSLTQTTTQTSTWDEINPEDIHNLAGKYRQGFGTPFDLSELEYSPLVDINSIRFVRIIDVKGSIDPQFASRDSQGNIINDPFPTPFDSCGFDLDGVAIINGNIVNPIVNFNELSLNPESFFMPEDEGDFQTGPVSLKFVAGDGYWSGFSYSNMSATTGNFTSDQFVSAAFGGIDGDSTNYAVSYIVSDWLSGTFDPVPSILEVTDGQAKTFSGLYVNNTYNTWKAMRDGTPFSKKFGGITGDDPDWYQIKIWGIRSDNSSTQTIGHYLADFRPRDNRKDYLQTDWRWIDLKALGAVKALYFVVESSDTGDFGINTPAYFCIDNVSILENQGPVIKNLIPDMYAGINSEALSVKMNDHFYVYNNDVVYEISENSNPDLISTSVTGPILICNVTPAIVGVAELTVKATSNGISVYDTFLIGIGSGVGIVESQTFKPEIYPNPTNGVVLINGAKESHFSLFNTSGLLLKEGKIIGNQNEISLTDYPSGIYILKIISSEGITSRKILKH